MTNQALDPSTLALDTDVTTVFQIMCIYYYDTPFKPFLLVKNIADTPCENDYFP